ncbi:MAG: C40 family peptidase [Bdellovibrionota bacterium]
MIRIEESDWLPQCFAKVTGLSDLLTKPVENPETLTREERDQVRNTQAGPNEIIRVLGHHGDYHLAMKIDESKGWIKKSSVELVQEARDFVRPRSQKQQPLEFLEAMKGVPYLWGGLSSTGVDCSGLTQLYFFQVHDQIIPRNSRDQRRFAREKGLSEIQDHDLVYAVGRQAGAHHVGLYLNGRIWHAYSEEGVACHTPERFKELFIVEAVNSLLS